MGGISGLAGGTGSGSNKAIDNATKQLTNKLSKEIKHNGLANLEKTVTSKTTKNAITYFQKNTSKAMNGIKDGIPNSIITTTAQNTLNKIADDITNKD